MSICLYDFVKSMLEYLMFTNENSRKKYLSYLALQKENKLLREIYMDYNATTPCDVVEDMMPYFTHEFGNSNSSTHNFGTRAKSAVDNARRELATVINCNPNEIIFTSGATESNNIAIKGCMQYLNENYGKNHLVTVSTEHKCVLESCKYLEKLGYSLTILPVKKDGLLDLDVLRSAITGKTGLVSVAFVHNEIGVIQDIGSIGKICRERGVTFHTDAAQAIGKVKIDLDNVDMMSFSAHKFYGPKGIGALYIRKGARIRATISGGGQEKGVRSGTMPVPLCVGMGKAALNAERTREIEHKRITELRDIMLTNIMLEVPEVYLNGSFAHRVPHNLNLSFSCVEGESLMLYMDGISVSSGSACTSSSLEPSYVLTAIGVSEELVHTSIRFSIGKYTTEDDVLYATRKIIESAKYLQSISPLWHMKQSGIDLSSVKWIDVH